MAFSTYNYENSDQQQPFCSDYLELNPNQASLADPFRFLWSCDRKHRSSVRKSSGPAAPDLTGISYRWLIFISLGIQRLLLLIKTPLAKLGFFLCAWLNLLQSNHGFVNLFLNMVRGNVRWPDGTSKTSKSVVGCLDSRLDLDSNIEIGDQRYIPQLTVLASKLSYENSAFVENVVKSQWKMKFLGFYNFWNGEVEGKNATQAFMYETPTNLTVVAFRGTEPFDADDWCTDIDISWYQVEPSIGKVHAGFIKALGLYKTKGGITPSDTILSDSNRPLLAYNTIRHELRSIAQANKDSRFMLTGHSLGGALAILVVAMLILDEEQELLERLEGVYTFGQPRVGDEAFGRFMEEKLVKYKVKYYRYVYCNDMVPRLPYDDRTMLFKHFGKCLFYDSLYRGKILKAEPNKNYFSLVWVVPKWANAWWELLRGLIILPLLKGSEYKENWCLVLYRVFGLIVPGLPAHGLQEYHNLTRLGTVLVPDKDQQLEDHHSTTALASQQNSKKE